jgi:hypothetical protein
VRVPNAAHLAGPWLINDLAPDFRLMDVWELPTPGGADDFPALLDLVAGSAPTDSGSRASRLLFQIRFRLGAWFGWDDVEKPLPIPGCSETTLRDRLPALAATTTTAGSDPDTAEDPIGPALGRAAGGFRTVYVTERDYAAELSNRTVHGVLHLAWVDTLPAEPAGAGRENGYRGHLAVYVKPRGRLGEAYLLLIEPFRLFVVYPALLRHLERAWRSRVRVDA